MRRTRPALAIHNMTPMAGVGADTALRDADLLRGKLIAATGGEAPLIPALIPRGR